MKKWSKLGAKSSKNKPDYAKVVPLSEPVGKKEEQQEEQSYIEIFMTIKDTYIRLLMKDRIRLFRS